MYVDMQVCMQVCMDGGRRPILGESEKREKRSWPEGWVKKNTHRNINCPLKSSTSGNNS